MRAPVVAKETDSFKKDQVDRNMQGKQILLGKIGVPIFFPIFEVPNIIYFGKNTRFIINISPQLVSCIYTLIFIDIAKHCDRLVTDSPLYFSIDVLRLIYQKILFDTLTKKICYLFVYVIFFIFFLNKLTSDGKLVSEVYCILLSE